MFGYFLNALSLCMCIRMHALMLLLFVIYLFILLLFAYMCFDADIGARTCMCFTVLPWQAVSAGPT